MFYTQRADLNRREVEGRKERDKERGQHIDRARERIQRKERGGGDTQTGAERK